MYNRLKGIILKNKMFLTSVNTRMIGITRLNSSFFLEIKILACSCRLLEKVVRNENKQNLKLPPSLSKCISGDTFLKIVLNEFFVN